MGWVIGALWLAFLLPVGIVVGRELRRSAKRNPRRPPVP